MALNQHSKGMTLVEMLVAIAIFMVIMIVVSVFEVNVFSYRKIASDSYTTAQDAQTILRTMTKEIRIMSPGGDGSYALQTAATNTVMFFADINGDGGKERVKYTFSGTSILRAITSPSGSSPVYLNSNTSTSTIIVNVRNGTSTPVFEYFDSNYDGNDSPLAQPVTTTAVRLIKLNITLDVDIKQSPMSRTYSTQVTLRNLKDNL
ncbi:MAG: prepilin-type N-terminal cleavage/methylation domain-containing protein [Candidatus Taylorbacteria bacterium]|nr:prepilin-type N-terminal cleavage/methylation domain-containing protein [Candidatus Taylorbacteria bacterium]